MASVVEFKKVIAFIMFLIIAVLFYLLYNQLFMSLNLLIDRIVDYRILGITLPTQAFIITDPLTVLIGGLLLGIVWKKITISYSTQNIIGMFILIFMFACVIAGIYSSGLSSTKLVSGWWILLCYVILGFAELFVMAIGLSITTYLAPKGKTGSYMGLWLVNAGVGAYFAAIIANLSAVPEGIKDITVLKSIYLHGASVYMYIAIGAFLFTLLATMFIRKLLSEEA